MFINRNLPTLSGQQTGAFDAMTTSALTVTGNASVAGLAIMSSLGGACITDSLTTYSSTRAASAAAVATLNASLSSSMSAYMPLAGGNISGPLAVNGMLYASNISVLGSFETVRAYETHSSNVVIDSLGTGPALRVVQSEGGALGAQPVAEFYNSGDPALIIDWTGAVAINRPTAGYELDVSGVVHASGGFVGNGSGLTGLASASAWNTSLTNVYIGAGSNVGIGTTPALGYALDVSGVIRSTGGFEIVGAVAVAPKVIWDTSGSSIYSHAGSNVGIGKVPLATSAYALDVSGSVNVSGSLLMGGTSVIDGNRTMVGVKAPVFHVYQATNQSITLNINTKITLDTVLYDTFSYWSSTNKRWTPLIAGYYQVSGCVGTQNGSTLGAQMYAYLYKNGTNFINGSLAATNAGANYPYSTFSGIVYMNGLTDYLELYTFSTSTTTTYATQATTFLCGVLVSAV